MARAIKAIRAHRKKVRKRTCLQLAACPSRQPLRHDPHDLRPAGELPAGEGAVKAGVAEGEYSAVGGDQPVAPPVGGGGDAYDRPVQLQVPCRAVKTGVSEGEYAAVGGDQPVAPPVGGGGDADDRPVQLQVPCRAVKTGVSEGEYAAVGGDQPVAGHTGKYASFPDSGYVNMIRHLCNISDGLCSIVEEP